MNDIEKDIKINGLKSGVLLGFGLTLLSVISYYVVTRTNPSPILFVGGPVFFSLLIPIFLVLLLCFNQRKNIGGFWSFKQATTGIFIMGVVAFLIQMFCVNYIFAKAIEPNMDAKLYETRVTTTKMVMQKANMSQAKIDEKMAEINKELSTEKQATIGNVIQNTAITIIFIFVLSLIFGALMKRELPAKV